MKFSGKMSLMIILKVTKNQGFTLSLGDIFSQKPQGGSAVLGIRQGEGEGGDVRKIASYLAKVCYKERRHGINDQITMSLKQ